MNTIPKLLLELFNVPQKIVILTVRDIDNISIRFEICDGNAKDRMGVLESQRLYDGGSDRKQFCEICDGTAAPLLHAYDKAIAFYENENIKIKNETNFIIDHNRFNRYMMNLKPNIDDEISCRRLCEKIIETREKLIEHLKQQRDDIAESYGVKE